MMYIKRCGILSYSALQRLILHSSAEHSVNNKPVKRLPSVARLPPAFYIGPHARLELWDSDAVFIT